MRRLGTVLRTDGAPCVRGDRYRPERVDDLKSTSRCRSAAKPTDEMDKAAGTLVVDALCSTRRWLSGYYASCRIRWRATAIARRSRRQSGRSSPRQIRRCGRISAQARSRRGRVRSRRNRSRAQRCSRAASRRPSSRALPGMRRHRACGWSPLCQSGPSRYSWRARRASLEQERRPAMPVPQLGRIDLVPARHLARLQQKEDGGECAAVRPGASRNVSRN